MSVLQGIVAWFADPAHWSGADGVPMRLGEHIAYCLLATVLATAIALPLGLILGHTGRGGSLAINVSNAGRAIPTFGIVILAFLVAGSGLLPITVALVLLAIPPILTNTYVAVRGIDHELRDAAEGMGMYGSQVLRQLEVPLAMPLIMAGIRTSAVQVVATATLAAFVSLGGLGRYIFDGLGQQVYAEVAAGAILVAVLALTVEYLLSKLQTAMTARGLRSGQRDDPMAPKTTATPA
ncbi:MAG: ABC transporter permease [Actinomycetota bacterium]|jgi:osmoprotectant transport system permease protein|nr:ABC transporter permease [Euzebyaceae bacterium]MDQ3452696.1 ABC transporter permease [Actinomycetota bacterium]